MRKAILLAFGGLALLMGCGNQGNKAAGIPTEPKWKGVPYRAAFDTKNAKPNLTGIPGIKFTANPDALERRTMLVIRFDDLGATKYPPTVNKMILSPVDISGAEGGISADYMAMANKNLSGFLEQYCVKGKVKISVAMVRSSLTPNGTDAEVDAKRLSDWLPLEFVFKNPHPKC